jgi:hypothetical protein
MKKFYYKPIYNFDYIKKKKKKKLIIYKNYILLNLLKRPRLIFFY